MFAQESEATMVNPFNSPEDRQEGARIFVSQCASCHGKDGRGGQGTPDMTTGVFKRASSDEGLVRVITKGVPGTNMPGFGLSSRQNWQVVAFIRSLAADRAEESKAGSVDRGAQLYAANGCGRCHDLGGAPDLAVAARRLTPSELRQAILDPQAEVHPDAWKVQAVTKDGRPISGARLNEDTFTVQYRDGQGQLRTAAKAELDRYEIVKTSPMPAFAGKLSEAELNDLIAFLVRRVAR